MLLQVSTMTTRLYMSIFRFGDIVYQFSVPRPTASPGPCLNVAVCGDGSPRIRAYALAKFQLEFLSRNNRSREFILNLFEYLWRAHV